MSEIQTQFKKVEKKYSLEWYWKNPNFYAPTDPFQCLEYREQHGEWPFAIKESDLVEQFYDIITAYQKRRGVWGDQFFTPPEGAAFLASKANDICSKMTTATGSKVAKYDIAVLDACAGFGMLTAAMLKYEFMVEAFERDFALCQCAQRLFEGHPGLVSIECEGMEHYNVNDCFDLIIANPPFSQQMGLEFFRNAPRWAGQGTIMLAILPNGFAYKTRPAALVQQLDRWEILDSWPFPYEFAHTKVKSELVCFELK
jgi:hypothetical protein